MASKIKVDQLETADGSGTIALQNQLSGMTYASMPSGSIIQVVTLSRQRTSSLTTSSQSYVTLNDGVGDFELSITPKFSNSSIWGIVSIPGVAKRTTNSSAQFTVFKGSSALRKLDSHYGYHTQGSSNNIAGIDNFTCHWVEDNVGTTNATTYTMKVNTTGGEVKVFDTHASTDVYSTMTLMDVAG